MINFPSDLAFELWKKSKEIKKPIYASYCCCGTIDIKVGERFTKKEQEYCPKCNPEPISFLSKLIGITILISIIAIIWLALGEITS